MRFILFKTLILLSLFVAAQKQVAEEVNVEKQVELHLNFAIADQIEVKVWKENKVRVEVSVSINQGEDDHLYELEVKATDKVIRFKHDQKMFESKEATKRNCWESEILYTVYMPEKMLLEVHSINADIVLTNLTNRAFLKTISGDIDITVTNGLAFKAKTISGEVYSDLTINYPDGKDGLKQIVGMNIKGIVGKGSDLYDLETISGNIFLRKG
ncbi:MAG: hypothetical protein RIA69_08095 [Cyclobacteriaceae bacterium]